ncbi:MAG TPA: hypothetical protein VMV59_04535 [Candidatus Dormibacteraeota bacterium]|nr:hypothetical protein [Candidatus Dormibacteraeota bacterium]
MGAFFVISIISVYMFLCASSGIESLSLSTPPEKSTSATSARRTAQESR